MKKVYNVAAKIYIIVCFCVLAWIIFSFANVLQHNLTDCNYVEWNAFVKVVEYMEAK